MKKLIELILVAAAFWFAMFSPWTSPYISFWYAMLVATGTLTILALTFGKDWKSRFSFNAKDIALGIGSAVALWGIFYLGNEISDVFFDFARPQVDTVYAMKEGKNPVFLTLALLLWIGPAEELFWRGYVQHTLEGTKYGKWGAFIITTLIYAFVHIWAFNFMLFMAALICGLFWGFIYMKNRNLLTVLISHALWDVAVFVLLPIT